VSTIVGLAAWLGCLVLLPAPMAARIFLVGPLVVVPALLHRLPRRPWISGLAGWPALLAAVLLALGLSGEPGPVAAALATPWLGLCCVGLLAAIRHGVPRLPGILHPGAPTELGLDVALGFLAVGAIFVLFDRLGFRPLDFSSSIILLTGIHFHVAGFGLLTLASFEAERQPAVRASVLGLMVGMPLTAAGFVLASSLLGALGALVVGLSGIGMGVGLLVRSDARPGRWLGRVAGVAFLLGMPLGIAWAFGTLLSIPFLDLETMVRTHGVLNAVGVLLASVAPNAE
jgi:hypothetical protein